MQASRADGCKLIEQVDAEDHRSDGADPGPHRISGLSLPVHQVALVVNGVHLLENLKLDELASKGVSEFAFVMQPLKIQGGSGSTVAPVAIR